MTTSEMFLVKAKGLTHSCSQTELNQILLELMREYEIAIARALKAESIIHDLIKKVEKLENKSA